MSPRLRFSDDNIEVWHGDARDVAAMQEPGSFSCAIFDGAYGLSKAEWDRVKVADLPEWYAPHLDDAGRILADSASLYLWNTAEGWATLHPHILARGWAFRSLIVWDKMTSPAAMNWRGVSAWMDSTEVCGFYTRGAPGFNQPNGRTCNVWTKSTKALGLETMKGAAGAARFADRAPCAQPLHPSQKPTDWAERMLRASVPPGAACWVPFGGTAREAVAAQRIARQDPAEARRVVTAELDMDGRNYLDAVVRVLEGKGSRPVDKRQVGLFGGGK